MGGEFFPLPAAAFSVRIIGEKTHLTMSLRMLSDVLPEKPLRCP